MDKQNCYRIVEFGKLFKSNYGNSDNCCILIHNATYFFFTNNFLLNKLFIVLKELYRNSGLIILYSVFHEICWIICDQQSQTVDRSAVSYTHLTLPTNREV